MIALKIFGLFYLDFGGPSSPLFFQLLFAFFRISPGANWLAPGASWLGPEAASLGQEAIWLGTETTWLVPEPISLGP